MIDTAVRDAPAPPGADRRRRVGVAAGLLCALAVTGAEVELVDAWTATDGAARSMSGLPLGAAVLGAGLSAALSWWGLIGAAGGARRAHRLVLLSATGAGALGFVGLGGHDPSNAALVLACLPAAVTAHWLPVVAAPGPGARQRARGAGRALGHACADLHALGLLLLAALCAAGTVVVSKGPYAVVAILLGLCAVLAGQLAGVGWWAARASAWGARLAWAAIAVPAAIIAGLLVPMLSLGSGRGVETAVLLLCLATAVTAPLLRVPARSA